MTYTSDKSGRGIPIALIAAGPLFISLYFLGDTYLRLPDPVAMGTHNIFSNAGNMLLLLVLAAIIGVIVAIIPVLTGVVLMRSLAEWSSAFRPAWTWAAIGAVIGSLPLLAFRPGEIDMAVAFALVATSAICAWLCGRWQ